MIAISVLDQAPRRTGGRPGHALQDALTLARHVDALGFRRFWIAEHHAFAAVSIAAPEVLIGHVAAQTRSLRVGSGGVLLPNRRPLHVAEQFCTLEALHPGRIDLGVGRSEGAVDPATVQALGRPEDTAHGPGYDRQLDELLAFGGVRPLPPGDPLATVRAVPTDIVLPPVTLLGSTSSSAETAARRGLPYAFASHTNPDGAAPALLAYRERFVPAREGDEPHAMLALKVTVGADDADGEALAAPWHLAMVRQRAGLGAPLVTVEEALAHVWTDAEKRAEERVDVRADAVGGAARVRARIEEMARAAQADEVFAITNTYDLADRLASYTRLAEVMALAPEASAAPAQAGGR
jgi:luciferase family oxidoreductase group 1